MESMDTSQASLKARQIELAMDLYSTSMQIALTDFQYVEECLRLYVVVAYDFIRSRTADKLQFKLDVKDLQKDTLGRLIDKFSKLSSNTKLVSELRVLQPKRNEIAHRGLMLSLTQQKDVNFLDEQTKILGELHNQLKPHIQTLLDERGALTGEARVFI
jgi:hypothetical protein